MLAAELEARYDIRDIMSFVEDLLRNQSNGPIFDTGEELSRFMSEDRWAYRYTDMSSAMGMESYVGMDRMTNEMMQHAERQMEMRHMKRNYR